LNPSTTSPTTDDPQVALSREAAIALNGERVLMMPLDVQFDFAAAVNDASSFDDLPPWAQEILRPGTLYQHVAIRQHDGDPDPSQPRPAGPRIGGETG
jgi:hypothetical protein